MLLHTVMKKIYVRTSEGRIEEQENDKIVNSLMKEADLPKNLARKIASEVREELENLNVEYVSGPLIRELTNVKLLQYGLTDARDKYTRVGLPVYDVTQLIFNMDDENANTYYNPGFVHKAMGDRVAKEYALLKVIPKEASREHLEGKIHIHDLDYFITRPFCFEVPARLFLKHGVKTDGKGISTAVAGPAKHLNSAVMQLAKVLQTSQTSFSGGQGYDFLNVILAPYAKGLTYDEIKQIIQYFIYELSMTNFSRGGQTAFTSVSLEFEAPDFLKKQNAVLPGGVIKEGVTYADFEDESKKIFNAFIDTYMEGDYNGKSFNFPKPEFKLRRNVVRSKKFDKELLEISKLTAKYGVPYFLNLAAPYMPDAVQSQCCRYFLIPDSKQMKQVEEGKLRFGSLQTVSINLPRCAYESKGNQEELMGIIDEKFEIAKRVFDAKRKILRKYLLNGGAPFLTQEFDGEPYFDIDTSTNTIGFVGLNELVKYMTGYEMHENRDAWKYGLKILNHLKDKTFRMQKTTDSKWSLVQTPAESAATRFAQLDQKIKENTAKGIRGTKNVYYTNSSHVFVGAKIPLWQRIKIESSFHPLLMGGAITHIFMGEKDPDPEAIRSFVKNVAQKTLCSYFSLTKDMTHCADCGRMSNGMKNACPGCGSKNVEWYSRVTGYLTPVKAWNAGKKAEMKDRQRYEL
ncbi:anaerobic ribonucleoside-triphosphate reductase [archaeon CG_4_10_14_0_2_um_filter_Archaea_38_6]|nr:MAG: anaerobic ribonucleoside-triphosphate reductase [archaeon CG07_land_8_20_14_0_80_38_8]PIU89573.1 MAG: anaerobic ribonucleoside-triphosphate reductase [archaeon CG06_land_8_20_14_3_00_37_11]PJA22442.1 MAG: anaerobic ribonucleoside-triphosphate reductase [archaeon CG_4_10_14_0_2_um_filter_Archaea_38_6]